MVTDVANVAKRKHSPLKWCFLALTVLLVTALMTTVFIGIDAGVTFAETSFRIWLQDGKIGLGVSGDAGKGFYSHLWTNEPFQIRYWDFKTSTGIIASDITGTYWRGFFTPILYPLIPSMGITIWLFIRSRRPRAGHCMSCGYDLTGNTSGQCPECGHKAMA